MGLKHDEMEAANTLAAIKLLRAHDFSERQTVALYKPGKASPWAVLDVTPQGRERFAVFPLDAHGHRGDTNKTGQAGVRVSPVGMHTPEHTWQTVLNRSKRMVAA